MLYDPKWAPPETEIKLEPWRQILLDAAKILETEGWTQGVYHSVGGRHCAVGAISKATDALAKGAREEFDFFATKTVAYTTAKRNLLAEANRWAVVRTCVVENWNDDVAKSAEEVISTMRKAANRGL